MLRMELFAPLVDVVLFAMIPFVQIVVLFTDDSLLCNEGYIIFTDITTSVMCTPGFMPYRDDRVSYFINTKNSTFFQRMNDLKDYYYSKRIIISGVFDDFISIYGLEFRFDHESSRYILSDRVYDVIDLVCISDTIFRVLGSVNDRGYIRLSFLKNTFITDMTKHLLGLGYKTKVWGNDELSYTMWHNFLFVNLYYVVTKTLRDHNYHKLNSKNQSKSSSIIIGLCLDRIDLDFDDELELLSELDFWRVKLYGRLDQYIKLQVQKRGITIMENSYTSFDSEYECVDFSMNKNKLLSIQTAVQRRTIIKIPLVEPFDISYVNPLSSVISSTYKNQVNVKPKYTFLPDVSSSIEVQRKDALKNLNELYVLNSSIKCSIQKVRDYLFSTIDSFCGNLICELKNLKDVYSLPDFDYYYDDSRYQIVFFFPLTPCEYKFSLPNGDFTLSDLLDMSRVHVSDKFLHGLVSFDGSLSETPWLDSNSFVFGNSDCDCGRGDIVTSCTSPVPFFGVGSSCVFYEGSVSFLDVYKSFAFTSDMLLYIFFSCSRALLPLYTYQQSYTYQRSYKKSHLLYFLYLVNLFMDDKYTNLVTNTKHKFVEWYFNNNHKAKSRTKLWFNDDSSMTISLIKNNYLIAHYNAADLSMLSDFDESKILLSVVGKSFLTLGLPIKRQECFLYVRDTKMLAPGGYGSLDKLGELYSENGDYSKRYLEKHYIEKMSKLLEDNKEKFIDYAMMDVKITAKHTQEMEKFNIGVKKLGVPSTLSSIGRSYVELC